MAPPKKILNKRPLTNPDGSTMMAQIGKGDQRGRPINRESKFGRLLSDRQLRAYSVAANANIAPRILTEYCGGRRKFTQVHLLTLCRLLDVTPDMILEDEDLVIPDSNYQDSETELTDSDTSVGGIDHTSRIEDIKRDFGPKISRLRKEA